MKSSVVEINGLKIGEGMPKICIPVVAENIEEIKKQAARIMFTPADMVEWRVDFLRRADDIPSVLVALDKLTEQLVNKPVLFTIRTGNEGGNMEITPEAYSETCIAAMRSGKIDLIDLEYMMGEDVIGPLMAIAKECGVKTVLSNHDFDLTPPAEELISRLTGMKAMGADIVKIAVMPHVSSDVIEVMKASEYMKHVENPVPVIAISMSSQGMISRMSGEVFGSAVSFASAGKSSAPGQIDADELDRSLISIHQSLVNEKLKLDPNRSTEKNNIIIMGFMGTGKTTIARRINEKTGSEVREMDDLIEAEAGMTITQMFDIHGEKYFRDMETEMVRKVTAADNTVISCGGGTVMRPENAEMLKKAGKRILLRAKPETILERVRKNGDKRPLLNRFLSRGYISWLMKKREDIYRENADYVIDVDGRNADAIADEIIALMS